MSVAATAARGTEESTAEVRASADPVGPADTSRWNWWRVVGDVVGLGALGAVALSGFGPVFGGQRYLAVGLTGLVFGATVALLAAWRRASLWLVALAMVVVEVVVGAALVQPDAAVAAVVPGADSVGYMVTGAFRGWVNLLTTTIPVGASQMLLIVPWVSGLLAGAAAFSISARASRPGHVLFAVMPMAVVLVAAILVGEREAWTAQPVAFFVLALVWGAARQRSDRANDLASRGRRRLLTALLVLGVAGAAGLVVGRSDPMIGDQERFVLRDQVEPPVDLRHLPSPLEGFRRYRTAERRDAVIFTVEGLESGDLIRLATLDRYDGTVWHVQGGGDSPSGTFERVGQQIPVDVEGEAREVTVEVGDYRGSWVPTVGALGSVEFEGERSRLLSEDLRYDLATGTAVQTEGLEPGDRYRFEAVVADPHLDLSDGEADPTARVPDPVMVDGLAERARAITAAAAGGTPLRRARAAEDWFRSTAEDLDEGDRAYFSDGDLDPRDDAPRSRPGHSAERMKAMLDEVGFVVGNEEQFASAMALIAHSFGLPARVVVGFAPRVADGPVEVTGGDVTAWTEVAVAGAGWIPLFPLPQDLERPSDVTPKEVPPPDRLFTAPPVTTPRVASGSGGEGGTPCEDCDDAGSGAGGGAVPRWVTAAAVVAGPPLAVIVGGTLLIAGVKGLRRRRRRRGPPAARVAGAWADVCDLTRDLGDIVPASATRREVAVLSSRPGVPSLARAADAMVFGPEPVTPAAADRYWRDADAAQAEMRRSLGWFARWKALVNPTSLRRARARPTADPPR